MLDEIGRALLFLTRQDCSRPKHRWPRLDLCRTATCDARGRLLSTATSGNERSRATKVAAVGGRQRVSLGWSAELATHMPVFSPSSDMVGTLQQPMAILATRSNRTICALKSRKHLSPADCNTAGQLVRDVKLCCCTAARGRGSRPPCDSDHPRFLQQNVTHGLSIRLWPT